LLFRSDERAGEQGEPDKARVLELAGLPAEEQDWMDDQEKAEAQRFKDLVKTLKNTLEDVKAFQAGKGADS
jgi:hypothetical protein